MDKAKQTKQKDKGNMLTKTFSLFVERNKHARNKKTTGTSFLELFFDLGIVFVFALLAKHLPSYLGIFHMDSHLKGVTHNSYKTISLVF